MADAPDPLVNLDAEQALIGALLVDASLTDAVSESVAAADFHEPVHQAIYGWILDRARKGALADGVTLAAAFETHDGMLALGGKGYIADLVDASGSAAVVPDYARMLRDLARRRALVAAAQDLATRARTDHGPDATAETIAAAHEAALAEIAVTGGATGAMPAGMLATARLKALRAEHTPRSSVSISTGLRELDDAIGRLAAGNLWVVGARPGMGKTALSLHVAIEAARQGVGVALYSMDMPASDVADRLLAMQVDGQRIEYRDIARRRVASEWQHKLDDAAASLGDLPILIDDRRNRTVDDLLSAMRRHKVVMARKGFGLGLVIVDHLQKVRPARQRNSEYAEATETARRMKDIAGSIGAGLMLCSQLNRGVESRDDRRPRMSDMRDTGAIEEEADVVSLLYREAYYLQADKPGDDAPVEKLTAWHAKWAKAKDRLEIINAKVRQGQPGSVTLYCDIGANRLTSLTPDAFTWGEDL